MGNCNQRKQKYADASTAVGLKLEAKFIHTANLAKTMKPTESDQNKIDALKT
jgi:hypothetical protein